MYFYTLKWTSNLSIAPFAETKASLHSASDTGKCFPCCVLVLLTFLSMSLNGEFLRPIRGAKEGIFGLLSELVKLRAWLVRVSVLACLHVIWLFSNQIQNVRKGITGQNPIDYGGRKGEWESQRRGMGQLFSIALDPSISEFVHCSKDWMMAPAQQCFHLSFSPLPHCP